MAKKQISFRLDAITCEQLAGLAAATDQSQADILEQAVALAAELQSATGLHSRAICRAAEGTDRKICRAVMRGIFHATIAPSGPARPCRPSIVNSGFNTPSLMQGASEGFQGNFR